MITLALMYATGFFVTFTHHRKKLAMPYSEALRVSWSWPWRVYRLWFPKIKL